MIPHIIPTHTMYISHYHIIHMTFGHIALNAVKYTSFIFFFSHGGRSNAQIGVDVRKNIRDRCCPRLNEHNTLNVCIQEEDDDDDNHDDDDERKEK